MLNALNRAAALLRCLRFWLLAALMAHGAAFAMPETSGNYRLGSGDSIRILVFQNPEMTLETRVSEDGSISYPLVGKIEIGGLAIETAEKKIAKSLQDGGILRRPQVNIQLLQIRANKVTVLGHVNKPGAFPLETSSARLSQMLAEAGGVSPTGADQLIVTGDRDGKPFRREVDVSALYRDSQPEQDLVLAGGDSIYVPKAPVFYIYGEVNRPGDYRVSRDMTMRQALAAGGGLTLRGTERRLRVVRKNAHGVTEKLPVDLNDPVLPDDVVYVNESIF